MRNIFMFLAVCAMTFMMSCSKEKDCTCTMTNSASPDTPTTTDVTVEGDCSDIDSETTTFGVTITNKCEEK